MDNFLWVILFFVLGFFCGGTYATKIIRSEVENGMVTFTGAAYTTKRIYAEDDEND